MLVDAGKDLQAFSALRHLQEKVKRLALLALALYAWQSEPYGAQCYLPLHPVAII